MPFGEQFLINLYLQCLNYSFSKLLVLNLALWGSVLLDLQLWNMFLSQQAQREVLTGAE